MPVTYQEHIELYDVKNGELVRFEEHKGKTYLKVAHGQTIWFIPIDLPNTIKIGIYSLKRPTITDVFNNKGKLRLTSRNDE